MVTLKNKLILLLLILIPFAQHGMEFKNNTLSFKRLCFGLMATTLGTLSLYDQLHNEKYSLKRSLFTGSCLLTGLVSLFGKFNIKPRSSCTIERMSITHDGRTTTFTRQTGDLSYTHDTFEFTFNTPHGSNSPGSDLFESPFSTGFERLTELENRYSPYLRDMRPKSRRVRRPIRPTPPIPPVAPVRPVAPISQASPFSTSYGFN